VAFVDYSTAYPSVHRDGLSSTLLKNDIRGNMWYHLRARFDKIKLQVLHPGISARHTVHILRGLPEGSRLSPTLFGIFVADLVHELRTKFPQLLFTLDTHRQTHTPPESDVPRTSGLQGLLYVDDLALMSICPRELQAMLHVCQHWSIRNRMQINTGKKKWPTSKPLPSSTPGGTTLARPNHAPLSRLLTLPNLRPSLVPYPRSLPI